MSKTLITLLTAAAALAFAGSAVAGGDKARGKDKADQVCKTCHASKEGDWTKPSDPAYPRLAGQHEDYLVTALNEYKQGDKSMIGRKNAVMATFAAQLTATEIQDLAAYLSSLQGPLHVKR